MFAGRFASVGIAGSRRLRGEAWRSVQDLAARAASSGAEVLCTGGRGAPAAARAGAPGARVFRRQFAGRAAFASRATAFVRTLAASPSPCLVAWPGLAAPAGLAPARAWVSCGSGSWSELALAAGLGVPVFLFLPEDVAPPAWWPGRWSAVQAGALSASWAFSPAQPQLL